MNTQVKAGHRRRWWAAAGVLALCAGLPLAVDAAQEPGPGAPIQSSEATLATLGSMAGVFDAELSGLRLGTASDFARDLAEIRPEARAAAAWPGADYALLAPQQSPAAESRAVGMAIRLDGEGTVCAEASVERAAARILLSEVACPEELTAFPVHAATPGGRAAQLAQRLPAGGELATGGAPGNVMQVPAAGLRPRADAARTCSPGDLAAVLESGNAAGNTDDHVLRAQNISTSDCLLPPLEALWIDQGDEVITPGWSQAGEPVTLLPLESAVAHTSYRPHQVKSTHQKLLATFRGGTLRIRAPHGTEGTTLAVRDSSAIAADAWKVVGYGVHPADDGQPRPDIAAPCAPRQITVTTPNPGRPSSSGEAEDKPLPYLLANIGTGSCRLDAGAFRPLGALPSLEIPSAVVLRPGNMAAIDIEGGAEDLSGTLTVDGTRHPGGYADAGEENRVAR